MELLFVDGGVFRMGSAARESNEKNVHKVTMHREYYVGKYPVTFDEYDEFCIDSGKDRRPADQGWGRGQRPVVNVNWYSALLFCNWLSARERRSPCYSGKAVHVRCDFAANGYRLPTEAQWEYAARGGRRSKGYRYSGSNKAANVGWYWDNSGGMTHTVGEKKPNELGIHDMSGNVWEWCWDWHNHYPLSAQTDPIGPASGSRHVLRGGSWYNSAAFLGSTYREASNPMTRYYANGFRVVVDA